MWESVELGPAVGQAPVSNNWQECTWSCASLGMSGETRNEDTECASTWAEKRGSVL